MFTPFQLVGSLNSTVRTIPISGQAPQSIVQAIPIHGPHPKPSVQAISINAQSPKSIVRTNPINKKIGDPTVGVIANLYVNRRRAGCVHARGLAALLAVETHRVGAKVPAGLGGHDMEEPHHSRGHATVAASVGGLQPRGEAVWDRRTLRSGACGYEGTEVV